MTIAEQEVLPEHLSMAVRAMFIAKSRPTGPWEAATRYNPTDLVSHAGATYICLTYHVSGSDFTADLAIPRWMIFSTVNTEVAAAIVYVPSGALNSVTVQAALDELEAEKQPLDATLTSLAALGTAADRLAYTTGINTWAETPLTAAARTILDDASVSAIRTTLEIVANPTGTIGLSAVNGTANTALRSDGAPALSQAIAPTWTALHTFTTMAGGVLLTGTPGLTVSNTDNPYFIENSKASMHIKWAGVTATGPDSGLQINGTNNLGFGDGTAFKVGIFSALTTASGAGDSYAANFVMNIAAGTGAINAFPLELNSNVHNQNYGDTAGEPTGALASSIHFVTGGTRRGTSWLTFDHTSAGMPTTDEPVNRGLVFMNGRIRLNTIEDYTDGQGFLYCAGAKTNGINLSTGTYSGFAFASPGFNLTGLGVIDDGEWQAGVIAGLYGGTGVANSGKTITLGGNLTTSGANAVTFTTSGATNVTLPTSGTLVNTGVTTLSSLASIGTVTTGVWNAGAVTVNDAVLKVQKSDATVAQLRLDNSTRDWTLSSYGTDFSPNGAFAIADETTGAVRQYIDSAGNFGFNGIDMQSAQKAIFIANATAAPSGNPTGGGILYVSSGGLVWRGSSGTVTPLAAA